MNQEASPLEIFTIGHSNLTIEVFLANLRALNIEQVVDVRTHPKSRFSPQFNLKSLTQTLSNAGINYFFAGECLGGRPSDPTCYKSGELPPAKSDYLSLVDYRAIATKRWYLDGIAQLIKTAAGVQTAIMCSEEDPIRCHRHHLIAQTLADRGITVRHLRKNGAVQDAIDMT
jgi:uncharacterized protein (DUF488 family)